MVSIRRLVILLDVRVSIGCFMRNNRGEGRDPINRFNSATFLHTSQGKTWIPNIVWSCCVCSVSSVKMNGLVSIGDVDNHHCLNFVFF